MVSREETESRFGLLDYSSNIFVLNEKLVSPFQIPYKIRQKLIHIVAFDGVAALSVGKKYS